jgi:uncharacterized membrane protein
MWFLLAFISAILGAVDVILNKKCLHKVSAAVLTWSLFTLSLPPIAYVALRGGLPTVNQLFYFGVIGSSLTFVFSKTITNHTLKNNQVSQIFPLTAFNGLFLYVLGLVFLSESIRLIPMIGLISIIIGSYILNADKAKEDLFKPFKILFTNKASLLFLFAILLNGITSIFDKTGINNTQPTNPAFTLLMENVFMVVMLTIYLITRENNTWIKELKTNFGLLLINSMVYTVVSLLVFMAFVGGPVALVMAVKRLQIFFILILGYLFFKDKPTKFAWMASFIMAFGVFLIKIG